MLGQSQRNFQLLRPKRSRYGLVRILVTVFPFNDLTGGEVGSKTLDIGRRVEADAVQTLMHSAPCVNLYESV